jgi:hypothetical protein
VAPRFTQRPLMPRRKHASLEHEVFFFLEHQDDGT